MSEKTDDQLDAEQYEQDLRWMLESAQGRRLMWRFLSMTGLYRPSFTGNSTTFFREGERNVGQRLTRDAMAVDPDLYMRMWRENARHEDFDVLDDDGREEDGPAWAFD